MANTFRLRIVSNNRVFYDDKAVSLLFTASDGVYQIMAHHAPMNIAVEIGDIKVQKEDGTWISAVVSQGFIEVANNRVNMFVFSCERPEEIDVLRAQEAKERAEEQLRQKQSMMEYHHSKISLARAMARLRAAQRESKGL
jgi:F-type H+-transporting ATPase subunit epsilon